MLFRSQSLQSQKDGSSSALQSNQFRHFTLSRLFRLYRRSFLQIAQKFTRKAKNKATITPLIPCNFKREFDTRATMFEIAINVILTSAILSFVLWLSKSNPVLGGFIVSLPLSTLIVLALSKMQNAETGNAYILAKSIFVAIPATLVFFVPFLLAEKLKISFWTSYVSGFLLLSVSFFVHKWIMGNWVK